MFFICILNGLQAILEYRQQLGKHVNHRGRTEFVGALFVHTICDHPLKSLLIYCGCLFSEDPSLSLGTASILISQLGLSCFCKEKEIGKRKRRRIRRGSEGPYGGGRGGGVGGGGGDQGRYFTGFALLQIFLPFDMHSVLWGNIPKS